MIRATETRQSVVYPSVLRAERGYTMWYGCHVEGGIFELFCSTSEDGLHWTHHLKESSFPATRDPNDFDGTVHVHAMRAGRRRPLSAVLLRPRLGETSTGPGTGRSRPTARAFTATSGWPYARRNKPRQPELPSPSLRFRLLMFVGLYTLVSRHGVLSSSSQLFQGRWRADRVVLRDRCSGRTGRLVCRLWRGVSDCPLGLRPLFCTSSAACGPGGCSLPSKRGQAFLGHR